MGAADTPANTTFNTRERLNQLYEDCVQAREGVGKNGDWCIDFHQRFDLSDAIRGCELIEDLAPYFVEDPVRAEAFLRGHADSAAARSRCRIAAGEEWGNRWDFNKLVEDHDIDYLRATLPNVGGITEMMKIAAICETHFVGIVPHFTGPISTAALVNCLGTFSGPVLMEYNYGGRTHPAYAGGPGFQERQALPERPAGPGRGAGYEAAEADRGDHAAGHGARADLLPAGRLDHQLVDSQLKAHAHSESELALGRRGQIRQRARDRRVVIQRPNAAVRVQHHRCHARRGFENFGVLVRLNDSALNSVFTLSVTLNVRKRLRFDVPQARSDHRVSPRGAETNACRLPECQRIEP